MLLYLTAGGIIALLAIIGLLLRNGSTPSVSMFGEIRDTIFALQRSALTRMTDRRGGDRIHGVDSAEIQALTKVLRGIIRFGYTIDIDPSGFLHTASSQMIAKKPEKYQVQCMLIAMLALSQQLESAGIDQKCISFDIAKSEMGTHFVSLLLSPEHHRAMLSKNPVAG